MSLDTSSSAIHLSLPPTSSTRPPSQITVHPSVVASILTHHSRRPTESESTRVIGALMGTRSDNGQEVDIRSCFAVPHTEQGQQISVDQPFQQEMLQFLSKNGTKEVLVGWYASSKNIDSNSAIIQEYFTSQTNNQPAVHLTVDTDLQANGQGLEVKGWVSALLGLSAKSESAVFVPVPVSIKYADSERPALDLITSNPTPSPSLPPLPTLSSSLSQLSSLIDQCLAYVQGVNAGTTPADVQVGKYLLEGLGRWSASGEKEDEGGVKAGLQDTLTVEYLSSLVRSQVELAGRLSLLQQQPAQ